MNWNITAGRPVYVQLVEQLELALVAGEFPPGSRIPPVRELAADAGVNPNTMQRALQELESRGLLQAQRTAGRTVTADDTALQALRRRRAGTLVFSRLYYLLFAFPLSVSMSCSGVQSFNITLFSLSNR